MSSRVCPVCNATFERRNKQIYCSDECYRMATKARKSEQYRLQTKQERWSWALEQAREVYKIAHGDEPVETLDKLAEFVYNNYKRR